MSRHRTDLKEVEQSPDGRYLRFDEKLGNGAFKEVYLSYDTETGKEVAWNTVELRRLPANEKRRIRSETEILAELQHPHIINFFNVWENKEKDQICFTTEIVTSGTLKQYTNRVKSIKLKVIKKWCRQILTALNYLHSHLPPIIHRDLKCDNIFINGGTGEIRYGQQPCDGGAAIAKSGEVDSGSFVHALHCLWSLFSAFSGWVILVSVPIARVLMRLLCWVRRNSWRLNCMRSTTLRVWTFMRSVTE
jgi:serine/threonine protein kinase